MSEMILFFLKKITGSEFAIFVTVLDVKNIYFFNLNPTVIIFLFKNMMSDRKNILIACVVIVTGSVCNQAETPI